MAAISLGPLSDQDVNSIMMDKLNSEDDSHHDAACRWVKGNRPRWTTMCRGTQDMAGWSWLVYQWSTSKIGGVVSPCF